MKNFNDNNDDVSFSLDLDLDTLNSIVRDMFLEQQYPLGEAIAKYLESIGLIAAASQFPFRVAKGFQATFEDNKRFIEGWWRPIGLLRMAYSTVWGGLDVAKTFISWLNIENNKRYLAGNIELAATLLWADLTGVVLVTEITRHEAAATTDRAFNLGLESARRTYLLYLSVMQALGIEQIVSSFRDEESEYAADDEPLFEEFTKRGVYPHERCLGEVEITLCRTDTRSRSFTSTNDVSEIMKDIVKNIASSGSAEEQPIDMQTEKTFTDAEIAKQFWSVLQQHVNLGHASDTHIPLEVWGRLARIKRLQDFSALWTAICIQYGDSAIREFDSTGEVHLLSQANWAYAAPLTLSAIWKGDLGTRYVAAMRLGRFFLKYKSLLKVTPLELAEQLRNVFVDVLQTNERLLSISPFSDSKKRLHSRFVRAVERLVEAGALLASSASSEQSLTPQQEALILAESGKARILRAELSIAERAAPNDIPQSLILEEKSKLHTLREIYARVRATEPNLAIGPETLNEFKEEQDQLLIKLEHTWVQMEGYGEEAKRYAEFRRDEPTYWSGLQWGSFQEAAKRLGERTAIVWYMPVPNGLGVFTLRYSDTSPSLQIIPITHTELVERYINNYMGEIVHGHSASGEWQKLGERILAPLEPLLETVECVCFIPFGVLHRIPLHALNVDGIPFIEKREVVYAPSISVLLTSLLRPKRGGNPLVIGAPKGGSIADELIIKEALKVSAYFQTECISGDSATVEAFLKNSQTANIIHIACHAEFDEKQPLNSGIQFVDRIFTARDWLGLKVDVDLVTLSGCSTGLTKSDQSDDLDGLMRSILFAGASSLLMTLWDVHSEATHDWMREFYRGISNNDECDLRRKSKAHRQATLFIKNDAGYPDDPRYWAPFILIGSPA